MKEMEFVSARTPKPSRRGDRCPEFEAEAAAFTRLCQGYGVPGSQASAAFLTLFATLEDFWIRA